MRLGHIDATVVALSALQRGGRTVPVLEVSATEAHAFIPLRGGIIEPKGLDELRPEAREVRLVLETRAPDPRRVYRFGDTIIVAPPEPSLQWIHLDAIGKGNGIQHGMSVDDAIASLERMVGFLKEHRATRETGWEAHLDPFRRPR